MKYSNDCSDACTHVMNDLLFLTSSVRKCTPGHSTSNVSMLWGEVSVREEWVTQAQKMSLAVQVREDMLHLWKV